MYEETAAAAPRSQPERPFVVSARRDDRQDAKDCQGRQEKTKISGESSLGVPGVLAVSLSTDHRLGSYFPTF